MVQHRVTHHSYYDDYIRSTAPMGLLGHVTPKRPALRVHELTDQTELSWTGSVVAMATVKLIQLPKY